MERYYINRELASVASGKVLLCTDKMTQQQVVVKRIRHQPTSPEKKIHRHLSKLGGHAHVLSLLADFEQNGYDHFVLEHCAKGELFDVVSSTGRLEAPIALHYFEQIVAGVQFIHSRGYAHMDLSLENVLVDAAGAMKVIDFGLAVPIDTVQRNAVGKYFYMAPEMFTGQSYAPAKADVWSLGIMLFIMLTGNPPFSKACSSDAVFDYVCNYGLRAITTSWKVDHLIPKATMDLLEQMLSLDPSARPNLDEVLTAVAPRLPEVKSRKASSDKQRHNVRAFLKNVFCHPSKKQTIAPALFGDVLLCTDRLTQRNVVIKKMQLQHARSHCSTDGHKVHEDMAMEKRVYTHVQTLGGHKNVLRLLNSFEEDGHEHFVLEYASGGDLFGQLCAKQRFSALEARMCFQDIVSGVAFLHGHGFAHGDLSLENVVVGSDKSCKLMDFGLASALEDGPRSEAVGKYFYMAPEIYLGSSYDAVKADLWSLGMLLLIMLTGMPPFGKANCTDPVFVAYETHGIRKILKGWKVLHLFSDAAMDLVERLLVQDPAKRMNMDEVLAHPYLTPMSMPSPTQDRIKKRVRVQNFFRKVFGGKRDGSSLDLIANSQALSWLISQSPPMDKYVVEFHPSPYDGLIQCTEAKSGDRVLIKRLARLPTTHKSLKRSARPIDNSDVERRVSRALSQKGGHPHVLKLLKEFADGGHDHLVFEHCTQSLFDLLAASSTKRLSPARTMSIFSQVVEGVKYMHKRGYAHCDLSLETIVVNGKGTCKVAHFALAADITKSMTTSVGKFFYMAPEMFTEAPYEPAKVDVWSLGVMLFIMLTGLPPFRQARRLDDRFECLTTDGVRGLCELLRVDHLVSSQAMALLELMLQPQPAKRIGLANVAAHPYLIGERGNLPAKELNFFQKVLTPLRLPRRQSVECDVVDRRRAFTIPHRIIFQLTMDSYDVDRVLAKALYGDVLLATDKVTGRVVAIKRMQLEAATRRLTLDGSVPIAEDVHMELVVNQALSAGPRHRNVMAMFAHFEEDGYMHFIFEYCPEGELFTHPLPASAPTAATYFRQIVDAIGFIHSRGYAHRDISLENVLLDGTTPKVCDFGLAIDITARVPQAVGKTFYMAPEMYTKKPYDPAAADVWALGILLLILLTGAPPFARANDSDKVFAYVKTRGITTVLRAWKLIHLVPPPALDLLERIIVADPAQRITMAEVLAHPFVKDPRAASRPRKRVILRRWLSVLRRRMADFLKNVFPSVQAGTTIAASRRTAV
ncbi:protein kinase [Achlya hypogyna]|uniref:Protein kinase n=1 Tax=Achlya hypogyna TaxID=1202772 RepID=A0A1V9ZLK7_ACHHY|nr:protein kinase [Achlya hypogyna]